MGRHYDEGLALFQLRKYREAVEAFTRELAADNQNPDTLAMRAAALLNCDDPRRAELDVLQALSLAPDYAYAFYLLSIIHHRLQGPRAALRAIHEALRLEPNAEYFHRLGVIYFHSDRFTESLEAAERALALDADDEDSIILRAKALSALGRDAEARDNLKYALALRADNPEAHKELGTLILKTGTAGDALAHLLEARRIDPIKHNDRLALAAAYGRLFWPLDWIDASVLWWRQCGHFQRWLCVVGLATALLAILLWTQTDERKPSTLAAIAVAIVGNAIALRFTLEWIARIAGALRLWRQLGLSWRDLSIGPEDFSGIVLAHGLTTAAAVASVYAPAMLVAVMSLIVLGWDTFPLLWKLPKLVAVPLLPASAFGILVAGTFTAIGVPNDPRTVLACWAGIVAATLLLVLLRIGIERCAGHGPIAELLAAAKLFAGKR